MASLYKNNGIWYIAVSHNGTRKFRSLKTKDIKVAKSIKSYAETIILQELGGFIKSNAKLSFSELVDHFLKASVLPTKYLKRKSVSCFFDDW